MEYGQLITRSVSIVWRHRYLWLLAILGGADVGSCGFYGNSNAPRGPGGRASLGTGQQFGQFVLNNLGVIVALVAVTLVLALLWFLLSCLTTGALVRASAEHDADRPFRLGQAWRTGITTFGSILGLRLLGLLFGLVVVAVLGLLALLGFVSYAGGNSGGLAAIVVVGVLVVLALIPIAILVGILFILATRSVVLEQRHAVPALGRAFELMRERLGRTLLVWLIQVGLSIGAGVAGALVFVVVAVVLAIPVVTAFAVGGTAGGFVLLVPVVLLLVALGVALAGITGSYLSTYWTLAFRRLELDPPRAAAWPPPQGYPPQPAI
jgi:uncharacterized membrane protein